MIAASAGADRAARFGRGRAWGWPECPGGQRREPGGGTAGVDGLGAMVGPRSGPMLQQAVSALAPPSGVRVWLATGDRHATPIARRCCSCRVKTGSPALPVLRVVIPRLSEHIKGPQPPLKVP